MLSYAFLCEQILVCSKMKSREALQPFPAIRASKRLLSRGKCLHPDPRFEMRRRAAKGNRPPVSVRGVVIFRKVTERTSRGGRPVAE
jgi:hypothetical protein